jgi:16S rRNA (uracil1498-N3)-methyltransferase
MHIPTIFDINLTKKDHYEIVDSKKIHHLKDVLRIKNGQLINLSDGQGNLYIGKFENNLIEIFESKNYKRTNGMKVFFPQLKNKNRLRFLIEKLTELCVSEIFIGNTEYTQNSYVNEGKINSWIISSIEQSGVPFVPKLNIVDSIDFNIFDTCLDISGQPIKQHSEKINNFAVGPEGGWSKKELDSFDFVYSISSFTLRVETATLTAAALLM